MESMGLKNFYSNKKVLITGNTGFKGSWLSLFLSYLGAKVYGLALSPESQNIYDSANVINGEENSKIIDLRDLKELNNFVEKVNPEIVFHMAAQPLVKESYFNPIETYEINIIGTVNLLESLKNCESFKTALIVTSDKCYQNDEKGIPFSETDPLGGKDPYSSSKACQEIVSQSYYDSFYKNKDINISTARAGNVYGGGDFSKNRIIPDIIRSIYEGHQLEIRNPESIRPWQHVLDVIFGYLTLTEKLHNGIVSNGPWNFGPQKEKNVKVKELIDAVGEIKNFDYQLVQSNEQESINLCLDTSKASDQLSYNQMIDIKKGLSLSIEWYESFYKTKNTETVSLNQISDYLNAK
jgi:CDP-glucose 4,6-dehydratase